MTEEEISRVLADMGQPAFRGKQVFTWLHRGVRSFDEMSNLSKPLRQQLAQAYTVTAKREYTVKTTPCFLSPKRNKGTFSSSKKALSGSGVS